LFKFVTIYRKVDESEKLEAFFSATHLPLAEQLPGLRKSEVSRIIGRPGGESRYLLMYELYFDSRAAFDAALLGSEAGQQLLHALRLWHENHLLTWFYAESFEEEAA
jgi:uncharacterized protein (TIGR02118 family)